MSGKADYKNKWQSENCDRINFVVPKGRKAELQAHAAQQSDKSLNAFITRAIDAAVRADLDAAPQRSAEGKQ